jgi:hypothetical protein
VDKEENQEQKVEKALIVANHGVRGIHQPIETPLETEARTAQMEDLKIGNID